MTFSGTCSGILPEGAELSVIEYSGVHAPGMESHTRGLRPKKGLTYKLNGRLAICTASSFRQGDEYKVDVWKFIIELA